MTKRKRGGREGEGQEVKLKKARRLACSESGRQEGGRKKIENIGNIRVFKLKTCLYRNGFDIKVCSHTLLNKQNFQLSIKV